MNVKRIRTGGQSGVDRAALEVARELNIEITGWCPKNGWAEDMPDPPGIREAYPGLEETPSEDVSQRTRWNVRDGDATLVVTSEDSPGTNLTEKAAREFNKPYFVTRLNDASKVTNWLDGFPSPIELNIGGPRESEDPGIRERTKAFLLRVFAKNT